MNKPTLITHLTQDIDALGQRPSTQAVRRLSAQWYRQLEDKTPTHVFPLCEALLKTRRRAQGIIAYDWAYRVRRHYSKNTFDMFERWLKAYVEDWHDCDDFCTHALGDLIARYPSLFERVITWCTNTRFPVRRAAAVVLVPAIKAGHRPPINPYLIADRLMHDEHDLVQKGYGWMLKVLSIKDQEGVRHYLEKHVAHMPRTAFRYALEHVDAATRKQLMRL